jgi:hypothetical protein
VDTEEVIHNHVIHCLVFLVPSWHRVWAPLTPFAFSISSHLPTRDMPHITILISSRGAARSPSAYQGSGRVCFLCWGMISCFVCNIISIVRKQWNEVCRLSFVRVAGRLSRLVCG